jgi:ssDNA-binding Zn-finger/Zn-ribbon topoisomerase 1
MDVDVYGERPPLCPKCRKAELEVRTGKHGLFLSCSTFPKCRGSMSLVEKKGDKVKWKETPEQRRRGSGVNVNWEDFEAQFGEEHANAGDR